MIGFALVGCGRIAQRHADLLGRGEIAGARLVAVSDIKPDRAAALGARHNVPHFTDNDAMMTEMDGQIGAVCVLTESGNHARNTLGLAKYRKHIVVEKPMALTLDDAEAMIRACDAENIKLFVVKQNRHNLPVQLARRALDEGRFGRIVMGTVRVRWCRTQAYYDQDAWRGTWAMDGGVFANQASHHIDLLEWFLGEPISVFAKARTALAKIEAEDTGVAVITFKSGAIGVIEATTATRPKDLEGSFSLLGEKGAVEIGGFAVNELKTWQFDDIRPEDQDALRAGREQPPDVYGFGHRSYLTHVVEAIASGQRGLVDGLEGRKSLELISAIYESIETGREVALRFKAREARLGLPARP